MVIGRWQLVAATATAADGSLAAAPYGPEPMGSLVLNGKGRMMAVLCDGRPQLPPDVKREYASYCGNFVIEGDQLITTVDAALIPERIGGQQRRRFELTGDVLVLYPPRRADGVQRRLEWHREPIG